MGRRSSSRGSPAKLGFKSRKERLGPGSRCDGWRARRGVSNPGRNVWDVSVQTLIDDPTKLFQIPEGTFGTSTRAFFVTLTDLFQIPEGTFGTGGAGSVGVNDVLVSNPGRNVWDAGPRRPGTTASLRRFKSRKERLGQVRVPVKGRKERSFKSRKERLGQGVPIFKAEYGESFKSRKERLGRGSPPHPGGGAEGVSNPGRNVWDRHFLRARATLHRKFQIPEGTFGTLIFT